MSKERIPIMLDHLRGLATAGKIETFLSVHVTRNTEGAPVPTVTVLSGDIAEENAGRIMEHMRGIGRELQASAAGGPYPPPVAAKPMELEPLAPWDW
ncbi:MAG: hypothetical protein IH614_13650 [Desulfuromonadales bacterium]|nr:hypothetical protein [Desulfuromonadales bacterium]